jgi:hypothetical protein
MKEKNRMPRDGPGNNQHTTQTKTGERTNSSNSHSKSNAVNTGNLSTNVRRQNTDELHTKKSVTGSDHDGQAD